MDFVSFFEFTPVQAAFQLKQSQFSKIYNIFACPTVWLWIFLCLKKIDVFQNIKKISTILFCCSTYGSDSRCLYPIFHQLKGKLAMSLNRNTSRITSAWLCVSEIPEIHSSNRAQQGAQQKRKRLSDKNLIVELRALFFHKTCISLNNSEKCE